MCVAGSYPALVFVGYILLFRFFVLQVVGLLVGPFAGPTVFLPRGQEAFFAAQKTWACGFNTCLPS